MGLVHYAAISPSKNMLTDLQDKFGKIPLDLAKELEGNGEMIVKYLEIGSGDKEKNKNKNKMINVSETRLTLVLSNIYDLTKYCWLT